MANGIFLNVNGMDKIFSDFKKYTEKVKVEVALEINASALNIQSNAKKNAPVNFGTLRNSIQLKEELGEGKLIYTIGSQLPYAPYVEFGTGPKVSVPSNYTEFAMQFKGNKGGTFKQMVEALMLWVKAKGITGTYSVKTGKRTGSKQVRQSQDKSAAYAIAISILKKGLRPQPYLIPAYEQEIPKLKENIKKVLNAKS
jgi:HK97 gp10 family phage protein